MFLRMKGPMLVAIMIPEFVQCNESRACSRSALRQAGIHFHSHKHWEFWWLVCLVWEGQQMSLLSADKGVNACVAAADTGVYQRVGEATEVALRVLAEKVGLAGYSSMPEALAHLSHRERATFCNDYWQHEYHRVSRFHPQAFFRNRLLHTFFRNADFTMDGDFLSAATSERGAIGSPLFTNADFTGRRIPPVCKGQERHVSLITLGGSPFSPVWPVTAARKLPRCWFHGRLVGPVCNEVQM
jgi:hypothetical protein